MIVEVTYVNDRCQLVSRVPVDASLTNEEAFAAAREYVREIGTVRRFVGLEIFRTT